MKNFHFGENLRKIRNSKGVSQEAIAFKMGISQTTHSRLEKSEEVIDDETIDKLAEALNVCPIELRSNWNPGFLQRDLSSTYEPPLPEKWYEPQADDQTRIKVRKVTYRLLVTFAGVDIVQGFWAGAQVETLLHKMLVAVLVGAALVIFVDYSDGWRPPRRKERKGGKPES